MITTNGKITLIYSIAAMQLATCNSYHYISWEHFNEREIGTFPMMTDQATTNNNQAKIVL